MKLIFINVIFGGIIFSYLVCGPVFGDEMNQPPKRYEIMTFGPSLVGGFNISQCHKERTKCFEVIRPEEVCMYYASQLRFDTMCDLLMVHCHDVYGPVSNLLLDPEGLTVRDLAYCNNFNDKRT